MGGARGAYGEGERCAQGSGGKPERKRPLGGPRCRWEDNIKMDLQEVGRGCRDWMELAWIGRGSKNVGNFLTSCRTS